MVDLRSSTEALCTLEETQDAQRLGEGFPHTGVCSHQAAVPAAGACPAPSLLQIFDQETEMKKFGIFIYYRGK